MGIARDGEFLYLQTMNRALIFSSLSYLVESLQTVTSQPYVIGSEQNSFESRKGVFDDERTEEMELLVHDVRGELTQVVLDYRASD